MDYVPETSSLLHTAVVKVAAILWNQDDVKNLLVEFDYDKYTKLNSSIWEKMEVIVVEKVTKLPLPKLVKEKILCFIKPVGFQIKIWKEFLCKDCRLKVNPPKEFCWTSQGTIDRKKTAEVMIKDDSIDITTQYALACIHCLEDDIPKLWDKIPKVRRISFYSTANNYVLPLIKFWTCYIKKDVHKINRMIEEAVGYRMPLYEYAFKETVMHGYRVAAEYFLQKLSIWQVDLCKTAEDIAFDGLLGGNYADIICFLLSYLDEDEQKRVFESNPSGILTSLLDYPFQHFFMDTANYMWNILEEGDYVFVLDGITIKIKSGYKDFDYQKLLGEFWQKIPIDQKRLILNESSFYTIIIDLFEIRDEDNIRFIFQNATLEEKKGLFYDSAQFICNNLLNGTDQLNLLKYFIRECLQSKDEMLKYKEHLESGDVWIGKFQNKNEFIHLLDEVICEFKKRKHQEGDNSKAKKV